MVCLLSLVDLSRMPGFSRDVFDDPRLSLVLVSDSVCVLPDAA